MSDELTGKPWAQAPWELVTAKISAQAFRVCMAIQLHRRPDGAAPFPSQTRLAKMCNTSVPTVKRAVAELVEVGILKVQPRRKEGGLRSTNSYSLHVPRGITPDPVAAPQGITGDPRYGGITDDPAEVDSSKQKERPSDAPRQAVRARTARDDLWDALVEATGIEPSTTGEKSRFGKSVNELLAAGATPDEIKARASRWPMKYPGASLTDRALANRWGELAGPRSRRDLVPCPDCEEPVPAKKLDAHRYDKHDVGSLCPDCSGVIPPDEEHSCKRSSTKS